MSSTLESAKRYGHAMFVRLRKRREELQKLEIGYRNWCEIVEQLERAEAGNSSLLDVTVPGDTGSNGGEL